MISDKWQRLYEVVLSHSPDLTYVFDLNHRFIFANKTLLEMWGRTWEEAIGKNCLELGYESWHAEMHDREIEQVIATKQPIRGEVPFTGTFGTRIYDYIFVPVLNDEGDVESIAGTTRDVTDRKAAEQNNARLAAIIESSEDAIISKNLDGIITSWNPSAQRLFGHTAEEAIGKPVTILIPPELFDEEPSIIGAIRRGERIEHYETLRRHKDGTKLSLSLTVSPIRDAAGKIIGASKIARDITQRKRAEEELRESEQRFRVLFESMNEGYCVAQVIFNEQDHPIDYRFLDINSAFERQTGLKDAKGKRMRELVPNHEQHWFDIYGEIALTGETRRFENQAAALNRWYDVCAFRIGPAELRHVGIVFNDITERKRASEALQQITNAIPQQVWSARPDGQIDYINAYCYEYFGDIKIENGIVDWISVVHPDDLPNSVKIWQKSLASGDDYDAEQRIFHKDSNEYRWNLSRARAVRDASGNMVKWYGTNTDIHDRKLSEQAIQDARQTAIELAKSFQPDAVFLDIGLPGMNGYEICRAMRKEPALKNTIIVAQTGWGKKEHKERSKEAGFDYHLVKPVNIEALKNIIALLDKGRL